MLKIVFNPSFKSILKFALAGAALMSVAVIVQPKPAAAGNVEFGVFVEDGYGERNRDYYEDDGLAYTDRRGRDYQQVDQGRYVERSDRRVERPRDRQYDRRYDRRHDHRHDRRHALLCSPRDAIETAIFRFGMRNARIVDVNRGTIVVAGWLRGRPQSLRFNRFTPDCRVM